MPGGDAMFGSTSHRIPMLIVRSRLDRQLSPNQTAYVGRGMSIVQSLSFRVKLMFAFVANALSGAMFHSEGSKPDPGGKTAFRFGGAAEKLKKPARWMYQGPPSCTWM